MELNQEDRKALYDVWMTKKAKMHMTQMEMTKRLGVSQESFRSYCVVMRRCLCLSSVVFASTSMLSRTTYYLR